MNKKVVVLSFILLHFMIICVEIPKTYLPNTEFTPFPIGMSNVKLFLLSACREAKQNGYIMLDPKILPGPISDPTCFFSYFFDFDFFREGMKQHLTIVPYTHEKQPDIITREFLGLTEAEMNNDFAKLQAKIPYLDLLEYDFFRSLRPNAEIIEISHKIIEKIGRPYTAIHVRIEGDWIGFSNYLTSHWLNDNLPITYDNFVGKEAILEKYTKSEVGLIKNVYLATSYKGKDLPELFLKNGYIPWMLNDLIVDMHGIPLTVAQEDRVKYPQSYHLQTLIEFEVCLQADVFVGNVLSSFSNLVTRTRYIMGRGNEQDYCYNMPDGLRIRTDYGLHLLRNPCPCS